MRVTPVFMAVTLLLTVPVATQPTAVPPHQIVFSRLAPVVMQLFIADGDGRNERALQPAVTKDTTPSFSPDGQWVVFTSERDAGSTDLYRIRPDGTDLERLTDHLAFDDQGALSPDGQTLAFVSSRGTGRTKLWVMDLATRDVRALTSGVGSDFRPSWSPDSRLIAFTSDRERPLENRPGNWELIHWPSVYVIRADGSDLKRLTPTEKYAGTPRWSPDGTRLVYYETTAEGGWHARSGAAVQGTTQLVTIDVATGRRVGLTREPTTKLWPQWMADGSIKYLARFPGGEAELQTVNEGSVTVGSRGEFINPSWSPDGSQVVYFRTLPNQPESAMLPAFSMQDEFELTMTTAWFQVFSPRGDRLAVATAGGARIEVANVDGTDRREIFSRQGAMALSPAWSPDGRQIAFGVGGFFRPAGYPSAQLVVVRADGTAIRTITGDDANNGFPSWSPDSTRIVYKKNRHLVITSLADGSTTPLTSPGPQFDNFPQWSPKGDQIVFTSDRGHDSDYRLFSVKPDGTDLRQIPSSTRGDGHSAWSPDGEWIIFSSARTGFKDERAYSAAPQPYAELFIMRSDGTEVRQLTDNKWEDAMPTWLPDPRSVTDAR